jgi:hypothetical protein
MMESISKIVRKSRQMLNEIGREPTPEELAEKLGMPLEKVRKVLKIAKEPLSLETPSQMGWAWDFRSVARSSKPMEDGCGRPGTHHRVRSFSLRYLLGRRDQPMVLLQPVRARCAAPALQTASLLRRRITSFASPAGASGF